MSDNTKPQQKETATDFSAEKELLAQLTEAKVENLKMVEAKKSADTLLTAAKAETETLKAQLAETVTKKEHEEVLTFLREEVGKVLTASGKKGEKTLTTFSELKVALEEAKMTLAKTFPAGGVAKGASTNESEKEYTVKSLNAYRHKT